MRLGRRVESSGEPRVEIIGREVRPRNGDHK
jgi:hypothetical protein